MQSYSSGYVQGRRTRVIVKGDAHMPPVLFLHGIGRSLEDWEPQFSAYRHAGYRVIALDLPGNGFSERLPTITTLGMLARSVVETLDVIGETRRLHVLGHSLGGAVAMQLLTLRPERVATLVLCSSVGFGSETHPMLRLAATPFIGSLATRCTTRASARMIERLLYADQSLATKERIDHALTLARQPDTGVVTYETARSGGTIRGIRPEWREKLLDDVSLRPRPTLIVWGDRDRILPVKQLDAAQQFLPHAQVHVFRNVGHMPQVEVAREFAQLTLNFLQSHAIA